MTEAKIEFDRDRAQQYDLDIRKAIPGYESLHSMAHSLLQTSLDEAAILVVGSGTGMELVGYAQSNPKWLLTGVDPSLEMMAIAKSELNKVGLSDRVHLHTGYVDSLPIAEPLDAATLILVMHFLPDDGAKLQLLKDIAQRLKPGAKLILADLYGDNSAAYFDMFIKAWQALYFSQLDDESKTKAEANFATSINNSIYFVTEARIIELLEAAGFNQVTKFYNAFLFGGWIAQYTGS
ncbi:MAG: class I SAM-dependent methyltransferase [Cyanobacteria bacterium P01_G01_bin.39]